MATNRDKSLQAAIELLGTEGIRSLTHLRVDEAAGLPRGSTSNHFRTRAALLQGVVQHMVDAELPAVGAAVSPASPDELVEATVRLFEFLTGPNRVMTAARLALYVEAGHDLVVRAMLARGRRTMKDSLVPALARLGAPDPDLATQVLASCFEGLFLQRIAGHADVDAERVLRLVVLACLAG